LSLSAMQTAPTCAANGGCENPWRAAFDAASTNEHAACRIHLHRVARTLR
jgi:hypothetical protein